MTYILDSKGRKLEGTDIAFVDKVLKLKNKSGSNPWPVLEEIVKFWRSKNRKRWDAYLIDVQNVKESRKDQKYASVHDKKNDGYLRYILDIPQEIIFMIRCVYSPDELPMDKKSGFFKEFAKKFTVFKVAKKT